MDNELKTIIDGLTLHVQDELKTFINSMRADVSHLGLTMAISVRRETVARMVGYLDAACASGNLLTRHRDSLIEEVKTPTGYYRIAACLPAPLEPLNVGEASLCRWQYKIAGGFEKSLWAAILAADSTNLAAIEKGFPLHVEAFRRYTHDAGYLDALVLRGQKQ